MNERWYVLRSKPHKESALCLFARANAHEIYYPTIPVKPVNPRASIIRPYFPGYMFVHTDLVVVGASTFRWMMFSQGLVCVGSEPAVVADAVVWAVQQREAQIWEAGGVDADGLKRGDRVVIDEGIFEGYEAIFDANLPGKERARVLIKMLSDRYVPVEVEARVIVRE